MKRRTLVARHWQLSLAAFTLQSAAFAVAYANKVIHNKVHFKSWHAWYEEAQPRNVLLPPLLTLGRATQ